MNQETEQQDLKGASLKSASTTNGIPLTEEMAPVLASANIRAHANLVDKRVY